MNVTIYKDLHVNIEFVTKKSLSQERSVRMQLSHIAHVRIAYVYACVWNDFVCDGDRACSATCRVPGSTTNANRLCTRARRQLPRPLECIHLGSDSRRPFDVHLRIHYHLQWLSHSRLQLISTTESYKCSSVAVLYDARSRSAIPCVVCLLNPAAWCANQRMCYVYMERIINARALRLSYDRMQVLKIVPYIRRHSL